MTEKTNPEDATLEAVRLLREGGYHEAAADLAVKALQRQAATPNASNPAAPAATTPGMFSPDRFDDQDAERAAGQQLIDAMRASGIAVATPEDDER